MSKYQGVITFFHFFIKNERQDILRIRVPNSSYKHLTSMYLDYTTKALVSVFILGTNKTVQHFRAMLRGRCDDSKIDTLNFCLCSNISRLFILTILLDSFVLPFQWYITHQFIMKLLRLVQH